MYKKGVVVSLVMVGVLLVGCSSSDKKSNPYKETHIVDVVPHYQIEHVADSELDKSIDQMTEAELKDRYGKLQKQSGLSATQQKEMKLIAERLTELSSNRR